MRIAPPLLLVWFLPFACDRAAHTAPDLQSSDLVGRWLDLAGLPEATGKRCCFFDSTRAGNPCPPDTLILSADGGMAFTSLPDEPSTYKVEKDSLLRFRGAATTPRKYAITLSHDTLAFAVAPLCDHNPMAARYRKVP